MNTNVEQFFKDTKGLTVKKAQENQRYTPIELCRFAKEYNASLLRQDKDKLKNIEKYLNNFANKMKLLNNRLHEIDDDDLFDDALDIKEEYLGDIQAFIETIENRDLFAEE